MGRQRKGKRDIEKTERRQRARQRERGGERQEERERGREGDFRFCCSHTDQRMR